jgi:hypothetical protein
MKCQEKYHFLKKVVLFVQKIKNGFFFSKVFKKFSKGCQKVVKKLSKLKKCKKTKILKRVGGGEGG